MTSPMQPVTVGEIFDRGITLFVRNAPVVMVLLAIYEVPHAIADRFDARSFSTVLYTLAIEPHAAYVQVTTPPSHDAVGRFALPFHLVADFVMKPLILGAVVGVLGSAHRGKQSTRSGSLRAVIESSRNLLIVWFATLLSVIVATGYLVVQISLPSIVGVAFANSIGLLGALGSAYASFVHGIISVFAAIEIAVAAFLGVVSNVALCIVMIERSGGRSSFCTAWRRTLQALPRAIVLTAAAMAVIGVTIAAELLCYDAVGRPGGSRMLVLSLDAAIVIVSSGVVQSIVVVFYEDQRLRSDGDDLTTVSMRAGASLAAVIA